MLLSFLQSTSKYLVYMVIWKCQYISIGEEHINDKNAFPKWTSCVKSIIREKGGRLEAPILWLRNLLLNCYLEEYDKREILNLPV